MRALRTSWSWAAAWLLGIAPAIADAQTSPADLLKFRPTQKGVEYDTPADKEAIDACKVEKVYDPRNKDKVIGFALRDAQGKLLRRFADTRGKRDLDQWSYYQDGFEVYRENDLDDDLYADECRWLNAGGTRIAVLKKNKITSWKRLSAEEASKVLVQALVSSDLALLETVLATPEELAAMGVPQPGIAQAAAAATPEQRRAQVAALLKSLSGWDPQTTWLRFDGMMPHVIPADPGTGLTNDLILYENAVIFVGKANGEGNPGRLAFLQVSDVVQVGDTWKFVSLPRASDPSNPNAAGPPTEGLRVVLIDSGQPEGAAPQAPELAAALKKLADFDNQEIPALAADDRKAIVKFHYERIKLLTTIVEQAPAAEKLLYTKQVVDSLAAAYQTGHYPAAIKALKDLTAQGGELASYAAFRTILAEYSLESEQENAEVLAVQKAWMGKLETFLKDYPKSAEAPDALLQLASVNEFNADEEKARTYYSKLAGDFPDTEPGKKAAGALRRLDLVGKSLDLKGTGLDGGTIDARKYAGKTVLIQFWTTTAEPVKRDLAEMVRVHQKYRDKGFEVIGVCLDHEKDKPVVEEFLKERSVSWPQVFEPGGMDSRLANEFGIISLPTMFLVDPQGKVIHRNIRTATDLEKLLEKPLSQRTDTLSLDEK